MATIKLGELLIKAGVLDEAQLKSGLAEQKKWGGRLGDTLVRMGALTEELLCKALARQLGLTIVNLDAIERIPVPVRDRIPAKMARDLNVVPIAYKDDQRAILVAMSEPQNLGHIDQLRAVCGLKVVPQVAGHTAIARALVRFYGTANRPMDEQEELPEGKSGVFKILDTQNNTRSGELPPEFLAYREHYKAAQEKARPAPPPPPPQTVPPKPAAAPRAGNDPIAMLVQFEQAQIRSTSAIRVIVELLIEKGFFTRDEYLAKMRR